MTIEEGLNDCGKLHLGLLIPDAKMEYNAKVLGENFPVWPEQMEEIA